MAKSLEDVKKEVSEMKTKLSAHDGFKPVYVKTQYKKGKYSYGVQFWSDFLINKGESRNSDGTLALLVEMVEE